MEKDVTELLGKVGIFTHMGDYVYKVLPMHRNNGLLSVLVVKTVPAGAPIGTVFPDVQYSTFDTWITIDTKLELTLLGVNNEP